MSPRLGARFVLPFLGLAAVVLLWAVVSQTVAADLPSPWKTWLESKRYILEPFFKDGEMNQGIGRLAFYSLVRVVKGYRLSLGIAWLVIVAAEMLTGTPGVGGFLWQEYNSLVYSHIILSVITIGAIGFVLDRLMGLVEARFKTT